MSEQDMTDVRNLGFCVGDRVRHKGRANSILAAGNGEGAVTAIAEAEHGKMSVHVLFDYVGKSGKPSTCAFDAQWFRAYPDLLEKI